MSGWATRGFQIGGSRFAGCRHPADQLDLVQEVFRIAFEDKARRAYGGLSPYEGYLFAITRSVVVRRLHARRREEGLVQGGELPWSEAPASPEAEAASAQTQALVQDFLGTLSDEERAFVRHRFVEERSQVQVAEALGWGRKKVRLVEERIRRALRRHVTAHDR